MAFVQTIAIYTIDGASSSSVYPYRIDRSHVSEILRSMYSLSDLEAQLQFGPVL